MLVVHCRWLYRIHCVYLRTTDNAQQTTANTQMIETETQTSNLRFPDVTAELFLHEFKEIPLKTLVFSFREKRKVLSTREGFREVKLVAENFCPPEFWDFVHRHPREFYDGVFQSLGISEERASFLFTGVDVERGAFKKEGEEVLTFVTADVMNAMCAGRDTPSGKRAKAPGTINIFIFTQAELSEAAMARTLITVTEAKAEALRALDIRSAYTPQLLATGTGTDHIVVVSGSGPKIERLRGHSKLSRLIARVVVEATTEAVRKSL